MRATASSLQTVYSLAVVCLLLTALLPVGGAAADDAGVPWWEAGDHWRYAYNQTQWRTETIPPLPDGNGTSSTVWHNISYTIMETVIGTTTVTVHNETYDVVVVGRLQNGTASEVWSDNISLSTGDSGGNYTGGGWLGLEYRRRSDHAIVKTETVQGSEVVSSGYTIPPFIQLGFPLSVGKTWAWTGRVLTPPHHEPRNVTASYICLRMTEVSTPAGTFDCYEISVGNRSDGDNDTLYYAPEAGNIVKRVRHSKYNMTGGTTTKELLSYSYTAEDDDEMPAFGMAVLFAGLAVALMLVKKRTGGERHA